MGPYFVGTGWRCNEGHLHTSFQDADRCGQHCRALRDQGRFREVGRITEAVRRSQM